MNMHTTTIPRDVPSIDPAGDALTQAADHLWAAVCALDDIAHALDDIDRDDPRWDAAHALYTSTHAALVDTLGDDPVSALDGLSGALARVASGDRVTVDGITLDLADVTHGLRHAGGQS
jgi:hypothetical protein